MKNIPLKHPIKHGSEIIASLTVRSPKAGDLRGLPMPMNMDSMLTLIGRVTAQPPAVVNEIEFEDLAEIMAEVGNFIGGGLLTGKQP